MVTGDALTPAVDAVGMTHVVAAETAARSRRTVRTYPLLCQFTHTCTATVTSKYDSDPAEAIRDLKTSATWRIQMTQYGCYLLLVKNPG